MSLLLVLTAKNDANTRFMKRTAHEKRRISKAACKVSQTVDCVPSHPVHLGTFEALHGDRATGVDGGDPTEKVLLAQDRPPSARG
jgi:hypothetical protein